MRETVGCNTVHAECAGKGSIGTCLMHMAMTQIGVNPKQQAYGWLHCCLIWCISEQLPLRRSECLPHISSGRNSSHSCALAKMLRNYVQVTAWALEKTVDECTPELIKRRVYSNSACCMLGLGPA